MVASRREDAAGEGRREARRRRRAAVRAVLFAGDVELDRGGGPRCGRGAGGGGSSVVPTVVESSEDDKVQVVVVVVVGGGEGAVVDAVVGAKRRENNYCSNRDDDDDDGQRRNGRRGRRRRRRVRRRDDAAPAPESGESTGFQKDARGEGGAVGDGGGVVVAAVREAPDADDARGPPIVAGHACGGDDNRMRRRRRNVREKSGARTGADVSPRRAPDPTRRGDPRAIRTRTANDVAAHHPPTTTTAEKNGAEFAGEAIAEVLLASRDRERGKESAFLFTRGSDVINRSSPGFRGRRGGGGSSKPTIASSEKYDDGDDDDDDDDYPVVVVSNGVLPVAAPSAATMASAIGRSLESERRLRERAAARRTSAPSARGPTRSTLLLLSRRSEGAAVAATADRRGDGPDDGPPGGTVGRDGGGGGGGDLSPPTGGEAPIDGGSTRRSNAPPRGDDDDGDDNDVAPPPTTIPNTKATWTDAESSRMRRRWWEAVRAAAAAGRRREEEEGEDKNDDDDDDGDDDDDDDDADGDDDEGLAHGARYDPMEPPSLRNAPFDEGGRRVVGSDDDDAPRLAPVTLPEKPRPDPPPPPDAPRSVAELEGMCIRSPHPLHCAVYNHALFRRRCGGPSTDDREDRDRPRHEFEIPDTEVVLRRLLTTHGVELTAHGDDAALRWKTEGARVSEIRALETNVPHAADAIALTDAIASDLPWADDATSLTPLQLAIVWDLPGAVRLLCGTTAVSHRGSSKNSTADEDGRGRTPLMLACELGRAACIEAMMRAPSMFGRLDRRERGGGNSAFHLCCAGPDRAEPACGNVGYDDFQRRASRFDAMDALLRHTPVKDQRLVLLSTNLDGRNPFHLACMRGDLRLLERLLECHALPGVKISRALEARDKFGFDAFASAVASDSCDVVEHLLATRFAAGPVYESWFAGCPLIVAVSRGSVPMVALLLDVAYEASNPYGARRRGTLAHDEVNRALLEGIRMTALQKEDGGSEGVYEIIRILVGRGGANPHQTVSIRFPGKPETRGDKCPLIGYSRVAQDETPLSAAVRAGDVEAVRCMITTYFHSKSELIKLRRNDPLLRSQPESYFVLLEEKEDDLVRSSVDTALVTSLFLLWQTARFFYGKVALLLFERSHSNLSSSGGPWSISQRALQWLENCISTSLPILNLPTLKSDHMEGYFQAPLVRYCIPNSPMIKSNMNIPYQDAGNDFMDWSYALAELPWFCSRLSGVSCCWLQAIISDSPGMKKYTYTGRLSEDEFYLVVGGQKLLAHKSIVSARSGKLAAHIRFIESHSREHPANSRPSIQVDHLPLLTAMMLMTHCYHGSIAFGLKKSSIEQCHQLLDLALIAEEYLCPSLLLECELRLLIQVSILEKHSVAPCICPQCSSGVFQSREQLLCPAGIQCLDKGKHNLDDGLSLHCEPVGVTFYGCFVFSNENGSLITPESGLDVLAMAQQLEQSSCHDFYRTELYRSGTINDPNPAIASYDRWNKKNAIPDGCVCTPFSAAKVMAVSIMLRNFTAVIKSESYLRQINSDDDAVAGGDDSFNKGQAGNDKFAIFLLQTCLSSMQPSR